MELNGPGFDDFGKNMVLFDGFPELFISHKNENTRNT